MTDMRTHVDQAIGSLADRTLDVSSTTSANLVHFNLEGRTAWHRHGHGHGQLLFVYHGVAIVQAEGQPGALLQTGERAFTPGGQRPRGRQRRD